MVENNAGKKVLGEEDAPIRLAEYAKERIATLKSRGKDGSRVKLPELLGDQYPAYERLALAHINYYATPFSEIDWQGVKDEVERAKLAGLSVRRIDAVGERAKGIYHDWLMIRSVARLVREQDAELLDLHGLGQGTDPQVFLRDAEVDGGDFADIGLGEALRIINRNSNLDS